ncbi:hypothetical protein [Flavicella sp.]|uniref:hypothetical protein n=1 Tax=Flavicella sp. TaxID=2957742 RepID=UPI00263005EE|nr:hypothetical protein [Flavicella sp.]MDG1804209.1 hypothetical protein [Flavicella sp.]MDG2279444.1 hypothetical protein [Flavicella sp.]
MMQKIKNITLLTSLIVILSGCKSSVEVINAWKSDKLNTIVDQNILVITRTEDNKKRGAFEEQMVAHLKKNKIKASTSYMKIPIFNDQREYTDEERKELVANIKELGFNAIILTSVKKRSEKTVTTEHGGYYTGGSYSSLYPQYYGGFYGYYNHPYSHPTYQSYVPSETYTDIRKSFVLETVIFNLELASTEQLVAVVTSAVDDPETVYTAAEEYVKEIAKALK